MEHRPAWSLGLPLAILGWLAAHSAAYELAAGDDESRGHLLAESGHGYLEHAPLAVALCLVLAAAGFISRLAGRGGRPLPAWLLGALPLLGFAVQEHLERLLHGGGIPLGTALEPVFLLGLALQLPFAAGAALLARALARVADAVAVAPNRRTALGRPAVLHPPADAELRRVDVASAGHAGRAPPVPA